MTCPLWKIEVPAPVPRVSTISTPLPAIAPKPCTSASFITRTGLPQRLASAVCRSKPAHSSVPRLGAVNTRPSRTAPGNPTDTRSKPPSAPAAASMAAVSVCGATGGAGVGLRTGLPMICPLPSSTASLMPVPPISTASVRWSSIGGAPSASDAPAYAASLPDPVAARLVPEAGSVVPGGTLWVDLHLEIDPGWHTYWRNPGDSGLPTEIAWELPAGFSAGDIEWPAPERFVLGTIGNYGYHGSTDLLVPIAAPVALKPGDTAQLAAKASWLVCSDI